MGVFFGCFNLLRFDCGVFIEENLEWLEIGMSFMRVVKILGVEFDVEIVLYEFMIKLCEL